MPTSIRTPAPLRLLTRISSSHSAVDCTWSSHGPWSPCSKPCGVGTQTRSRAVLQEARGPGAIQCRGAKFETRICNRQTCGAGIYRLSVKKGWLNRISPCFQTAQFLALMLLSHPISHTHRGCSEGIGTPLAVGSPQAAVHDIAVVTRHTYISFKGLVQYCIDRKLDTPYPFPSQT